MSADYILKLVSRLVFSRRNAKMKCVCRNYRCETGSIIESEYLNSVVAGTTHTTIDLVLNTQPSQVNDRASALTYLMRK